MILYHFTSDESWLLINADQLIDPERSKWTDGVPKALSFSTSPNPGALPSSLWNCTVRITVDVPDHEAKPQRQWFSERLGHVAADNLCTKHGGDWRCWRTVERAVPAREWVCVEHLSWTRLWPDSLPSGIRGFAQAR